MKFQSNNFFLPNINLSFILIILSVCLSACNPPSNEEKLMTALNEVEVEGEQEKKPNILFILADDLGYSDLGIFGSEIPTPNLDELANNGLMLTDFYANMTCSPTRSMLMSGTDSHLAGLGVMGSPVREEHKNKEGYLGYLNFRVASLADLLTDAGYNTYMTGKWHLGSEVETGPKARGFKKSFVSLDGAAHLGGWDWRGPQPAEYRDGDELVYVDENFYTTEFYTEQMIEYIEEDRNENKPFFAYLAYTAPHWPLQAPEASIARFKGWYDDGYEALYKSRFDRMQNQNLISATSLPVAGEVFNPRWKNLTETEQQLASKRMEIYAAMVSDLDIYVGQVIEYLKEIGEFENTFIMFMSDNGAEPGRRDLTSPISDFVGNEYDNSLENIGKANSYVMYGRNWATASETATNGHKFTAFDGGIHVPAFVHFPKLVEAGTRSDGFGTVMDILPTFLSLAGTVHPGTSYRGQEIFPVKGKSLLPMLSGNVIEIHDEDEFVGWELYGHRSIRQGNWKIVWDADAGDAAQWMLFNLANDRQEQTDLGLELPDKLAQMIVLWDQYELENGVIY